MAHDEPVSKFSSLDKVRIQLLGVHHVVSFDGPCESLRFFSDNASWQYVDFGEKHRRAIVIHECQPSSDIFDSLRGGRKARLCYSQLIVWDGERTMAIPEYHLEKINSPRGWRGLKSALAAIRKFTFTFKG